MKVASALFALPLMTSCAVYEQRSTIDTNARDVMDVNHAHVAAMRHRIDPQTRSERQRVGKPWITGAAQPLAQELTLPAALRKDVRTTMIFTDGDVDLVTAADRIHMATGILVRISPDALLPAEWFLPRLAIQEKPEQGSMPSRTPLSVTEPFVSLDSPLPGSPQAAGPHVPSRALAAMPGSPHRISNPAPAGTIQLARLLDAIALRLAIHWRYDAALSAIVLYRTETRAFDIKHLANQSDFKLGLGLKGNESSNSSGDGGGQFSAVSESSISQSPGSALEALKAKVEQYLTRAGSLALAAGGAPSMVVTDTPDVLNQIAAFLEREVEVTGRQMRLVFEEITVEETLGSGAGINWNLAFNSNGMGNLATLGGLNTMLQAGAPASIGVTVGSGQWAGSSIAASALSQVGRVVRHQGHPMYTRNLQPVTLTGTNTVSYVDNLAQTPSYSNNSAPTVTVSQRELTTGTFLTVVPELQSNGNVMLTISYNNSRLIALERQEFGSGESRSFVQSPNRAQMGGVMSTLVKPGQPVLIAGFQGSSDAYQSRRLDAKAPMILGGSDAADSSRTHTLLVVTAHVEDGR